MRLEEFKLKYHYHDATTVMQQYLDVKFLHLDCLLLFRMGDFYELFFEDAILASKILSIILSKRGKTGDQDIAMCGIPHHALDNYLPKLLAEGLKIAICDQLETPEEAKKRSGYKAIVTREVTRIITPGTITEENLLQSNAPNYLASLFIDNESAAICAVDVSTSEIFVLQVSSNHIASEIAKLNPNELLLPESLRHNSKIKSEYLENTNTKFTFQVNSFFSANKCLKSILDFYKIPSIKAIGELSSNQIIAIGSIIEYLSLTQKKHIPELPLPQIIHPTNFMAIDGATMRNLEIVSTLSGARRGSLLDVINQTQTKSGSRMLYRFLTSPLIEVGQINKRLELTNFFYSNAKLTAQIRHYLDVTEDLDRALTKISMKRCCAKDLLIIKQNLTIALKIKKEFVMHFGMNIPTYLHSIIVPLSGDEELLSLIEQSIILDAPNVINEGGMIKHDYNHKVQELYALINNSKNYIEKLKLRYQQETGIDTLKILHNNILGLFIEITNKQSVKIESDSHFIHRQTTANGVRYTTQELQKLESEMLNAKTLAINLELQLFQEICEQVLSRLQILRNISESLSTLDVFCNFAHIAKEYNYVKPDIVSDLYLDIKNGRHPVIEKAQMAVGKSFIGNNCQMQSNARIQLLTGPNMSGKSTYLRQNALIIIMAHIGSFVPASSAKIGIVDKMFSRIGSGDDLMSGQSTFMVEMLETSAILSQSTERSFIILDEVGRGTSTYDGVSIAWAIIEYIHDRLRCMCLFATHYHELTNMANFLSGLKNYTVAIEDIDDTILFLYHIIPGFADKSYGIHVAELAGLPKIVIKRAREILNKLEKDSNNQTKSIVKIESNNFSLFE